MSIPAYLATNRQFSIGATRSGSRWTLRFAVMCVALVIALEILVRSGAETSLFLPAPSVVLKALVEMIVDGTLAASLAATGLRRFVCLGSELKAPARPCLIEGVVDVVPWGSGYLNCAANANS